MVELIGGYDTNQKATQVALSAATITVLGTKTHLDVMQPTALAERRAYNANGQVEYIGEAAPGTAEATAEWRIQKRTYVNNRLTKIEWCDGNANMDNTWTNYDTHSYS